MKKTPLIFFALITVSASAWASTGKKEIHLRFADSATYVFDETTIFLDLGSQQFIYPEDGQKIFDTSSSAPVIYSFSINNVPCFSNSYGTLNAATVIPLGFKTAKGGTFTISSTLLDNFDATSIIRIEDRSTGIYYNMLQGGFTIHIAQATEENARFFLHISAPTAINTSDAGCSNNDGLISVAQDPSIIWSTCTLLDKNFNQLNTYNNITGSFNFNSLPFGTYNLVFAYGSYSVSKQIQIIGRSVTATASASTVNATVGQSIQFFVTAVNATDFVWDFGDGSQINGIMNPTFSYNETGTYNVSVRCSNVYGCSSSSNLSVLITEATAVETIEGSSMNLFVYNKTLKVLTGKATGNFTIELYNTSGQLVSTKPFSSNTDIDLSNSATGVYIARVSDGSNSFSKKIVLQ